MLYEIAQQSIQKIIQDIEFFAVLNQSGKLSMERSVVSILKELSKHEFFKPTEEAVSYNKEIFDAYEVLELLCSKEAVNNVTLKIQAKEKNQFVKTVFTNKNAYYIGTLGGDFSVLKRIILKLREFLEKGYALVFLGNLINMQNPKKADGSIAVLLLALILSIKYPGQIVVLRGKNETEKDCIECAKKHKNNWLYKFSTQEKRRCAISLLMEIFAKLPITLLQKTPKGCYLASSGAPMYMSKNGKVSYTVIFSGGFIDNTGSFIDPNSETQRNTCLYNEILRYPYTSPFYGAHKDGDSNKHSGNGCFVGHRTLRRYKRKEIIGCICGYIPFNAHMPSNQNGMEYHKYFYLLLTGDCLSAKSYSDQAIGYIDESGKFIYYRELK